ncbi:hypothetical protein FACS18949_13260 [Clostridia bacterium]|nr:hypothetical protein FACS18949_13260 [Clostridia bacterium]
MPVGEYHRRDELLGIDHVGIAVRDMPDVLNFYVNQLGMKQLFTLNREGSDEPWFEFVGINNHQTIKFIYGATVDVPTIGTLQVRYTSAIIAPTLRKPLKNCVRQVYL